MSLRALFVFAAFAVAFHSYQSGAATGGNLFIQKKCVRCHTVGRGRFVGPDLKGVFDRYSHEDVLLWITDPQAVYASQGRAPVNNGYPPMPPTGVSSAEAEKIADYLFSLRGVASSSQDAGVISGKVVNRTTGKAAAGETVSLNSFLGDRPVSSRSATAARDGGFVFKDLSWSAAHKISITKDGVLYETGGMVFRPAQEEIKVDLPVYDTTVSDDLIAVDLTHLIVEPSEDGARISEFVEISNAGKAAFVPADGGTERILGIPEEAKNIRFVHGGSLTLLPGSTRLVFVYSVPAVFTKKSTRPVSSFVVLASPDGLVDVKGLGASERVRGRDGSVFSRWAAQNLESGSGVTVSVKSPETTRSSWVLPFSVFALFMAVVAVVLKLRGVRP